MVSDKVAYQNGRGRGELPVHATKEIHLPRAAADPQDSVEYQFLVRDGDWCSPALGLNRYLHRRYNKRKRPTPKRNDAATNDHDDSNTTTFMDKFIGAATGDLGPVGLLSSPNELIPSFSR